MSNAPIPTLDPLWRPNDASTVDDRELIRGYALWPISRYNLTSLTATMNRAADASPAAVRQCQEWIDEIESLSDDWAGRIADNVAHLGNAESYEGILPGTTISRQDQLKKADVLEWDTNLLKVKVTTGKRSDATSSGVTAARIETLKNRVLQSLGVKPYDGGSGGSARLIRS